MAIDKILWDVGANMGSYSLKRLTEFDEIVCFEPVPWVKRKLCDRLGQEGWPNYLTVMNLALGDCDEVRDNQRIINAWTLMDHVPHNHSMALDDQGPFSMEVVTIDTLIKDGHKPPTHMKIDVDGYEPMVLRGGKKLFRGKRKPKEIYIELSYLPSLLGEKPMNTVHMGWAYGYRWFSADRKERYDTEADMERVFPKASGDFWMIYED